MIPPHNARHRRRMRGGTAYRLLVAAAALLLGCAPPGATECRIVQPPVELPTGLDESSGVALSQTHPGTIWTHNDSGSEPELFAIGDARDLKGRVKVAGAELVDWEDLDIGECDVGSCLYIADTGDNLARRDRVGIYRIAEPEPTAGTSGTAEFLPFQYPDGPRDAEAIFVLPGEQLFVVSKGRTGDAELFRYPSPLRPDETVVLEWVRLLAKGPVPLEEQITGAGASPSGNWVAIRSYKRLRIWNPEVLVKGGEPALTADLTPLGEVQGEAVALLDNGAVVLTSEGGFPGARGTLSLVECPLVQPS